LSADERMKLIESSSVVGPGVFYSTLIVIASFYPFSTNGDGRKLFSPLAWTKSFILIVDAFLATLTPVLISYLLKGTASRE
jgi:Cu(I)/Ag(I) efflux system membrane protein CusA/SilA